MNHYRAGQLLRLPKLGTIKVNWSRLPNGIPKMVTLKKDKTGKYWVTMACDEVMQTKPLAGKTMGIDMGTTHFASLSDGTKIDNPRFLQQGKDTLKKLQQRLARQQKTSNRRQKTKLRIARLHQRIANQRQDFIHQFTTRIINDNQVILVEDLHTKGMTKSSKGTKDKPGKNVKQKAGLNRSLLDVSIGEVMRQLEYKAKWYGRTIQSVDRFYPSSKTCSCCGHKLDELRLDERQWQCPKCHAVHDRDINAAVNIEREGLRLLTPVGTDGEVRDFGGEGVYSVTVSPRSSVTSKACLEQGE